ncbi:tRNA-ribosyltransferase [Halobacteriales archaeon QS_3_64_16]|nr:MAG: tRNA-ribosyltransferase [Halobacteriales archaeon QS_3_64_16]
MTECFEVHEHDGAARVGELRLAESVTTPALVDRENTEPPTAGVKDFSHHLLRDAGSLWPADREQPAGGDSALTILPHRGLPAGTPAEVGEAFASEYPNVEFPSAAVLSTDTAADHGTDAYALSDTQGLVGHARAFVEGLIEVRETIPADTALYLSGVALPANAPLLVYAGVDLVDPARAIVKGTRGKYLTSEGECFLSDLTELPCPCPACSTSIEEFDRENCVEHNVRALVAELATVRERIRGGRLRDYLEGQVRHDPWLAAALRRFDSQYNYLEERTPILRNTEMLATTEDSMRRVEIQRFADRVTSRYRSRFDAPLVLVPCSARKPYSDSQSHGQFNDAIQFRGHVVSMTSPIGVVPQELEHTYPAQHYDSAVTGRWSAEEIEFVASVLTRYLERNDYPRVIAHVPPEGYREVCERAAEATETEMEFTVPDHPTTEESLTNLAETLAGEPRYGKREREHRTIRAIADYQFGAGAGAALFEDIEVESRVPKLRVLAGTGAGGEQLATMVPQYGVLALTLAGARRWANSEMPTRRVAIDEFVPRGSVLAPGITGVEGEIRVGDEVVIDGPEAFGIGRAAMCGREMETSTRGIAVSVRHVEQVE